MSYLSPPQRPAQYSTERTMRTMSTAKPQKLGGPKGREAPMIHESPDCMRDAHPGQEATKITKP